MAQAEYSPKKGMKCAIYCRLSREDGEKTLESESIQNQRAMLEDYAAQQGWAVWDVYCDEDYSGADGGRPEFCRLLREAKMQCFQVVLCKTQSRFTRDMELVERYLHGAFPLWGIRFVAVADHVDTELRGNKKARQINGLVNQWYLEDLSENVRMVLDFKRARGQYIASSPLYGYRKDPADKNRLLIDEQAAAVVREIFARYLDGQGSGEIARRLNDRGEPSPSRYKNPEKEGVFWNKTAVSRILRNEMYTGVMIQGRRKRVSYKCRTCLDVPPERWFRVEDTHPAIVDGETFRRAARLLERRGRADGSGRVHPLSGLVVCGDCGRPMTRTANGSGRAYLRCRGALDGGCSRHGVALDTLTRTVVERLAGRLGEDCRNMTENLQNWAQTPVLREVLVCAVERVAVGERDETGCQTVELWWRF